MLGDEALSAGEVGGGGGWTTVGRGFARKGKARGLALYYVIELAVATAMQLNALGFAGRDWDVVVDEMRRAAVAVEEDSR